MDALNNVLTGYEPTIRREAVERFFFKSYPFRITLDAEAYVLKTGPRARSSIEAFARWRAAAREMLAQVTLTGDTKVRNQAGFTCVYFDAETDVITFLGLWSEYIRSVALPENQSAMDALRNDRRIVIRETLFWHQFRWSGVFKQLDDEQLDEIRDWLDSFKDVAVGTFYFSYSHSAPRIYFTEEDDLFMFSFSFFNRINRLEKVLLKEEIAHDSLAAEGAR